MMETITRSFNSIQALREADAGVQDNGKLRKLSGFLLVSNDNDLSLLENRSLKEGKRVILPCDLESNIEISIAGPDAPAECKGTLDVGGFFISEGYNDKDSYFLIRYIHKYD